MDYGISIEKRSIAMELLVLKYYSKRFLKENILPNFVVLYFNSIKSVFPKQVIEA
jgi:hypothetical protein